MWENHLHECRSRITGQRGIAATTMTTSSSAFPHLGVHTYGGFVLSDDRRSRSVLFKIPYIMRCKLALDAAVVSRL